MSNFMFRRKLNSIEYPDAGKFDINDVSNFKNLISWLEDQKIRHYKIEDRQVLRDLEASNWNDFYVQYLNDISCPYNPTDHAIVADWCLTFALRLEFEDNLDFYKGELANKLSNKSANKKVNPLDNLDFESNEFKECVEQLANHLKIPLHSDNLITLKAILIYIQNRFNEPEQMNADENSIFKLEEVPLGFEVENNDLKNALRLLRLLYVNNLRDLQTNINQILVQVQSLTANPKTDTKLGRVGR